MTERIVTGKTTDLLGASAALLLNALKAACRYSIIRTRSFLLQPSDPIQKLKTEYLGSRNPRLHTDEVLIALSTSAATNPDAQAALDQLPKLTGCQVHTSVLLSTWILRPSSVCPFSLLLSRYTKASATSIRNLSSNQRNEFFLNAELLMNN